MTKSLRFSVTEPRCVDGFTLDCKDFYTNMAILIQAHIKMEAYGYAIADATKALELDPTNVKVYTIAHSTSRSLSF